MSSRSFYTSASCVLLLSASLLLSADYPGKAAPAENKSTRVPTVTESTADLLARTQELLRKRQQKKADLLKNDLRLRRLRNQILRLARELALEVDSRQEIRALNEEISKVDQLLQQK